MSGSYSPTVRARAIGFLYLLVILCGAFAEAFVRQRVLVAGDPRATAANILANEQIYRWAFVADLFPLFLNAFLAVLFFGLFKHVNRSVAGLVVIFLVIGSAVQAAMLLFHLAPLLLLKGSAALAALQGDQAEALAYLSLRLQGTGYNIALAFFGCFGLSLGYLIIRSTFLPRLLGVLMVIAGLCYLTNSMLTFLAPSLSSMLIILPVILGEGGLTLWLLVAGVDDERWESVRDEGGNGTNSYRRAPSTA